MEWLVTMILLSFSPSVSLPKSLLAAVRSLCVVGVEEGVHFAGLSHLLPLTHFGICELDVIVEVSVSLVTLAVILSYDDGYCR